MMRAVIRAVWLLLIASLMGAPTGARSATPLLTQYRHTAWSEQGGVAINANGVVQTKDGYLWVGTANGLLRFDGVRFVPITHWAGKSLPIGGINSLFAASDGSLWIGMTGRIFRLRKDGVDDYSTAGRSNAIAEDQSGAIWLLQSRTGVDPGVCRIENGATRCFEKSDVGLQGGSALVISADGAVWMGGATGICRWTIVKPADCYLHDMLGPDYALAGISAILQTRRGEQWVGIMKAGHPYGIGHLIDGRWVPYVTPEFNGAALDVTSLLEDADETLWIGTFDQGIYRIDHGRVEHFDQLDGLSDNSVSDMRQDRDGTVWVATANGLDAFQAKPITVFSRREGLPANVGSSVVAGRDGRIWVGSLPLSVLQADRSVQTPFANAFKGKLTSSMLEDRQGRLWAGMQHELFVIDGKSVRNLKNNSGTPIGAILQFADDGRGGVWAVTVRPRRLLHIVDFQIEELMVDPDLRTVALTSRDTLLLGFGKGSIREYDVDVKTAFDAKSDAVGESRLQNMRALWPIVPERDRTLFGSLDWIEAEPDGTIFGMGRDGLLMLRGDRHPVLGVGSGLPCKAVTGVARDAHRALWLKMNCGIVQIGSQELEAWFASPTSQIKYRYFDASDGFRAGSSGFSPLIAVAPDGRLWFANDKNVQMIDPKRVEHRQPPPPIMIEEITADRVSHSSATELHFAPRTRDIEIHYTALSYVLPAKVKFKYRLEGRDRDWTDVGTRRVAYYTDLEPGNYRFRVIACNSDGIWNEAGAAVGFEVQAAFYQTRWFMIACVLMAFALLYAAYILRLKQLAARYQERLATKIAERERIARDLHDTLLQSTEGLVLVFQAASNRLAAHDPGRSDIDRALNRASELIAEGRDRVQDLRSTGNETVDLEASIRTLGESSALAHGIEFHLDVEGSLGLIDATIGDEVYLILREALSNAFEHAAAQSVDVQLRSDGKGLRASIRDDGCGLEMDDIESGRLKGHWGIKGMQERARHIGAVLDIRSRVGAGTEIELFVPMRASSTQRWRGFGWARGPRLP